MTPNALAEARLQSSLPQKDDHGRVDEFWESLSTSGRWYLQNKLLRERYYFDVLRHLPGELVYAILLYLPPKEVVVLQKVSRSWRQRFTDPELLARLYDCVYKDSPWEGPGKDFAKAAKREFLFATGRPASTFELELCPREFLRSWNYCSGVVAYSVEDRERVSLIRLEDMVVHDVHPPSRVAIAEYVLTRSHIATLDYHARLHVWSLQTFPPAYAGSVRLKSSPSRICADGNIVVALFFNPTQIILVDLATVSTKTSFSCEPGFGAGCFRHMAVDSKAGFVILSTAGGRRRAAHLYKFDGNLFGRLSWDVCIAGEGLDARNCRWWMPGKSIVDYTSPRFDFKMAGLGIHEKDILDNLVAAYLHNGDIKDVRFFRGNLVFLAGTGDEGYKVYGRYGSRSMDTRGQCTKYVCPTAYTTDGWYFVCVRHTKDAAARLGVFKFF